MRKALFGLFAAAAFTTSLMAQEAAPAAAPAVAAEPAPAVETQEKSAWIPSVGITLEYMNKYMSDGFVCTDDDMLFGDLSLSWDITDNLGVYGDLWMAYDANGENKDSGIHDDPEEIDYTGGVWYTFPEILGGKDLTVDMSLTYWDMPERTGWNVVGSTQWKLALDLHTSAFKPCENFSITPGITPATDFENGEWQIKTYVKTSWDICEKLNLANRADLFWFNGRWACGRSNLFTSEERHDDLNKSQFATLVLSTDLMYQFTDNMSFGPFCKVSFALDHEQRDAWDGKNDIHDRSYQSANGINTLWGVRLAINF